jgi:hypothetical protein
MKQKNKDIFKGVLLGSSLTILGIYLYIQKFRSNLKKTNPLKSKILENFIKNYQKNN